MRKKTHNKIQAITDEYIQSLRFADICGFIKPDELAILKAHNIKTYSDSTGPDPNYYVNLRKKYQNWFRKMGENELKVDK